MSDDPSAREEGFYWVVLGQNRRRTPICGQPRPGSSIGSACLLSQRLRELETSGILYRKRLPADPDVFEYCLTDAVRELRPIVEAFGMWGQRFVDAELSHPNMLRFAVLGCGPCVPVDLGRLRSTCWRCSRNREQRGQCNLYPSGR
jgi:HxlR-like helix-turn-helix